MLTKLILIRQGHGPHVSNSGEVNLGPHGVKQGQTRRRLAAGKARRGRAVRVLHSGDQKDGGDHLRDAGSEPRRVVAVGGAGVAGNIAGDKFGRGRSSGEDELVARGYREARGLVR